MDRKPILCLDFDGVIHSYSSGWQGADVIPDPPVDGAMQFIDRALDHFQVSIFSSRSGQKDGIYAMRKWLRKHWLDLGFSGDREMEIKWPTEKPAAFITIDDRAILFDGKWPDIEELKSFQPWNKRPLGALGTFSHGKVSDDDEGDLRLAIAYDKLDGIVRIEFGKPVAWLGLPPPQAIEFAKAILKKAGAQKIEITI